MTCEQIADKIEKHLKKLETLKGNTFLYISSAWGTTKVNIRYKDYWDYDRLTKEEAVKYLQWLEKGNIGTHIDMEK